MLQAGAMRVSRERQAVQALVRGEEICNALRLFRSATEIQILWWAVPRAAAPSRGTSPQSVEPMTSRSRMVTILAVLAFVAFLLYSTMSSQRYQCTVTVEFQGGRQTATASAATESAATEQ